MSGDRVVQDVPKPMCILFVEDNPDDLRLCLREMERAKLEFTVDSVCTEKDFLELLGQKTYDCVVADYRLSGWDGMRALQLLRGHSSQCPFILVSGILGDETAVDCIKQGASNYVLKEHLARLPVVISHAIREVELKRECDHATALVKESEETFRTLAETVRSMIFIYQGGRCRYCNREAEIVTGYSREELITMNSLTLIHPDSRETVTHMGFSSVHSDVLQHRCEVRIVTRSGETKWLDMTTSAIEIEGKRGGLITAFDITERKRADEEVRRLVVSDPLTGLSNYRQLVDTFNTEAERSRRTGRPFSLVLLDLDGLKKINDVYGHLVGSRALCRVATILHSQCRSLDTSARYGGDEFAIILPEAAAPAARHLIERIAKRVREDREAPPISASFGLGVYPENGNDFKEVFHAADRELYTMKGERPRDLNIFPTSAATSMGNP